MKINWFKITFNEIGLHLKHLILDSSWSGYIQFLIYLKQGELCTDCYKKYWRCECNKCDNCISNYCLCNLNIENLNLIKDLGFNFILNNLSKDSLNILLTKIIFSYNYNPIDLIDREYTKQIIKKLENYATFTNT